MTNYALRRPCPNCPFRTDIPGYLREDRAREIAASLAGGAEFPCHKTTVPDPDDDGQNMATSDSQFCAGALIVLEHMGQPNQMMRIAERFGVYQPAKLDKETPVAYSLTEFVSHHAGRNIAEELEEGDTCAVVDAGCLAPAGYMVGGVVQRGTEFVDSYCTCCGEPACENCMEEDVCNRCKEWED